MTVWSPALSILLVRDHSIQEILKCSVMTQSNFYLLVSLGAVNYWERLNLHSEMLHYLISSDDTKQEFL